MCIYALQYGSHWAHEVIEHWNVVSATEELNFKFYLILISLNLSLNGHMWLVATLLDSVALELRRMNWEKYKNLEWYEIRKKCIYHLT